MSRGRPTRGDSKAAAQLPIPTPNKKTARMIENVYTVPPKSSDSRRVQITSAPSAAHPDNPIARYTAHDHGTRAATSS